MSDQHGARQERKRKERALPVQEERQGQRKREAAEVHEQHFTERVHLQPDSADHGTTGSSGWCAVAQQCEHYLWRSISEWWSAQQR